MLSSVQIDPTLPEILRQRRQRLQLSLQGQNGPILLWSGHSPSRNFPANRYPFRASSHFLYFAGLPIPEAAIQIEGDRLTLFVDEAPPSAALWHGPSPSRDDLATWIGADAAYPLTALEPQTDPANPWYTQPSPWAKDAATIGILQGRESQWASLDRTVFPDPNAADQDRALAEAIVALRLQHDPFALDQIQAAIAVSIAAHHAGLAATPRAKTEAQVRAAMEAVIQGAQMTPAYTSIVTVHGEVLHNEVYHHSLAAGQLLLADVGAETPLGWAADITRTWPVGGRFSATQRAIYAVVLAAHDGAIAALKPGVEYREIHLLGCRILTEGLVDLGILRGDPDSLVEQDAHALFFPHGMGHLLGLDVHDMEDLGDLAGYAPGRQRSDRFGLGYLRLDRPLQDNMVVTIEPGFYQVPAILNDPQRRDRYAEIVNWDRLAEFSDVPGIRIEDDVQITATGATVLTAALPTSIEAIEALIQP